MICEIISIGTELLLGNILNTNAQYISKRLAELGIFVYYQTTVGDNIDRIKKAIEIALHRSDIIITTGGLGPTQDDLTKEAISELLNIELVYDEFSLNKIQEYFEKRNIPITDSNKKQALVLKGSKVLINNHGLAPGMIIEKNDKILIILPGPPREMIPMFDEQVTPFLKQFSKGTLYSEILRFCGIGESLLEEKIKDLIKNQKNPTIAPYISSGEVILRITSYAESVEEGKKLINPVKEIIVNRLKEYFYGEGDITIEEVIAKLLIDNNLTISIAESCTGGLLTSRLVNVPGISKVLKEGIIAYSNESKIKRLSVREDTIKKYGAVSKECALEMAEGVAKVSNSNIGLSITGIAGPEGGTPEKPVGLVYTGLYINGIKKVNEFRFSGDRERIRTQSVLYSLNWLRQELVSFTSQHNIL